jgi:hypothetical protein
MTEQEWLTSTDPKRMLSCLVDQLQVDHRRLRLFACACCRHLWDQLPPAGRVAVETAERFADGQTSAEELTNAATAASRIRGLATSAAVWAGVSVARTGARMVVDIVGQAAASRPGTLFDAAEWEAEHCRQVAVLRDIFGNPFLPVSLAPAWRGWQNGTIPKLAEAIYQDRRFEDLPVLADAIEEAGCSDGKILGHCRRPADHVRGCWVVDLLK